MNVSKIPLLPDLNTTVSGIHGMKTLCVFIYSLTIVLLGRVEIVVEK